MSRAALVPLCSATSVSAGGADLYLIMASPAERVGRGRKYGWTAALQELIIEVWWGVLNPARSASSGSLYATAAPVWYNAVMVTLIPIEPISGAHGMLIVEAFNKLFINGGGQSDGCGYGATCFPSWRDGCCMGYGGMIPEEWRVGP